MTHLNANIKPKGHIRLVLSNIQTGAIEQELEIDNVITTIGEENLLINGNDFFGYNGQTAYSLIWLGLRPAIEDKGFVGAMVDGATVQNGTLLTNNLTHQNDPLPDIVDIHCRFNPDVAARTIWTIGLGFNNPNLGNYPTATYASLTSPCTQSTSQVLDVYYRIEVYTSSVTGVSSDVSVNTTFSKQMARWFYYPNNNYQYGNQTLHDDNWDGWSGMYSFGFTQLPTSGLYNTAMADTGNPVGNSNDSETTSGDGYYLKMNYNISSNTNTSIGRLYGFVGVGQPGWINSGITTQRFGNIFAFAKFGNASFQYKPIQPIFNHSITTTQPFLDVSNLATGTGTLTVNGSAWTGLTNPQWSDFYRVDIRETGAVGSTYYAFSKRHLTGFNGGTTTSSNYDGSGMIIPFGSSQCLTNGHNHNIFSANTEQYSNQAIIMFDKFGLSLYDILKSNTIIFDSTTTPALPVNATTGNIQQVAVDANGNIWVADAASGLYLITAPYTSPTITNITPSGATKCYGVAPGNVTNGKMWAVFDTGLQYSTNQGASWTAATLTFPGGNFTSYSNVLFIRCDPQSTTDQMVFVVPNTAGNNNNEGYPNYGAQHYWWQSTVPAVVAGAQFTAPSALINAYGMIRCSNTGSFWAGLYGTNYYARSGGLLITPNSTTVVGVGGGSNSSGATFQTPFLYDNFGNPYFPIGNYSNGNYCEVFNKEGTSYGVINGSCFGPFSSTSFYYLQNGTAVGAFFSNGVVTAYPSTATMPTPAVGPGPAYVTTSADAWNGHGTIFQDMVWKRYGWNGTAWVLGYNAPVTDSVHSYVGTRVNFALESHTFTGRSYIDVSPVITSNTFTTSLTFTAYINPVAKPLCAETNQVLFDIYNQLSSSRVILYWNQSGNVTIGSGVNPTTFQTFGTTPSNGSNYRVVFVLNGTSASLYINGTQFGSTITLAAAQSFAANSASGAQAVLGSRASKISFPVDFFSGSMTNVQFWNNAWNSTDIAADNAAPTAVIASPSNSGAVVEAVWSLTNSLATLETKATSATPAPLLDGITIAFNNGTSGNSFVTTDYYTFGVVDGILKDNATTFSWTFPLLLKPNRAQTTFTSAVDGTAVIPSTASSHITERATWGRIYITAYDYNATNSIYPGSYGCQANYNNVNDQNGNIVFSQTLAAGTDGYVQFTAPAGNLNSCFMGWCGSGNWNGTYNNAYGQLTHSINCNVGGTFNVYESGNSMTANIAYAKGDVFKIARVGGVVTYYQNGTAVYTSTVASTGAVEIVCDPRSGGSGYVNITINYAVPAGFMSVGSLSAQTGIYDPNYRFCDDAAQTMSFSLNGTPLTSSSIVVETNMTMDQMVSTGAPAGGVLVNPAAGKLYFNPANYGNTLTGSIVEVTDI